MVRKASYFKQVKIILIREKLESLNYNCHLKVKFRCIEIKFWKRMWFYVFYAKFSVQLSSFISEISVKTNIRHIHIDEHKMNIRPCVYIQLFKFTYSDMYCLYLKLKPLQKHNIYIVILLFKHTEHNNYQN